MDKKYGEVFHQAEYVDGKWYFSGKCTNRATADEKQRDITLFIWKFQPFDSQRTQTLQGKNFLNQNTSKFILKSGQIHPSIEGKRLIVEVGCNSIIYILNKPGSHLNYHYFIQSTEAFAYDVFTRYLAHQVATACAPIVTIVKYEMYFLMGILSTVSIPMLIAVTGSDIAYNAAVALHKFNAVRDLINSLSQTGEQVKEYAPTLHRKIMEYIHAEVAPKITQHLNQLPKTIAKDEKTQAQLAGTLVGKALISPKALTAWGALMTILSSLAIKSMTKTPQAYTEVYLSRYKPIIAELSSSNWANIEQKKQAIQRLIDLLRESGVKISYGEMVAIFKEVNGNSGKLKQALDDINKSFKTFIANVNG